MWEKLIPGLGPIIEKMVNLIPDPQKRAEAIARAEKEVEDLISKSDEQQSKVNEIEASSTDRFTSRWRPAAGWVCVISLALYYWPQFILTDIFWCMQCWKTQALVPYPPIAMSEIMGILSPLLGIGGYRMMEKKWGVTK